MLFSLGGSLTCRCVGCGHERPVPNNDRSRLPARGKTGDGLTLEADGVCPKCRKARRVRIRLEFDGVSEGEEE